MNVVYDEKREKLVIEIDCSKAAKQTADESASGKMMMLGTTHGFMQVPNAAGVSVSVNAGFPNPNYKRVI